MNSGPTTDSREACPSPPESGPIRFFNRYTRTVETETVYGEAWIRHAYGTVPGRLALHLFVKRALFSRWYGWRMDRPASRAKIKPFIRTYGINTSEFADPPESFRTFNEFFYRRLKPEARPIHSDPATVVFPADGRHLGFPNLSSAEGFFVKGQRFDLRSFLQNPDLVDRYAGGPAIFSRLCPVDYHRFHFPVTGVASAPRRIEGFLWSVNPLALRRRLAVLWENRRWLTEMDAPGLGRVLMAEIGATNVGSAIHTYDVGTVVGKGAEKGFFRFGGSAVLTLFQPESMVLSSDLLAQTAQCRELYAHMGDLAGQARF